MSKEYFEKQEEEISNTYMHANGVGEKGWGQKRFITMLFIGVAGYVIYRMTTKKK